MDPKHPKQHQNWLIISANIRNRVYLGHVYDISPGTAADLGFGRVPFRPGCNCPPPPGQPAQLPGGDYILQSLIWAFQKKIQWDRMRNSHRCAGLNAL